MGVGRDAGGIGAERYEDGGTGIAAEVAAMVALGVEVDEAEAAEWLAAVAESAASEGEHRWLPSIGVGGHRLALLDFDGDPGRLGRLRRLAGLVGTRPGADVGVALAVAGSSAQSRIQPFPADIDFFERVHFAVESVAEAKRRFAALVLELATGDGARSPLRLEEIVFGYDAAGRSRRWCKYEFGSLLGFLPTWALAGRDPGFVKVTWFLAEEELGGPTWVSKVIDATWQDAAEQIANLDGGIDADFQQIYLDDRGMALASRLTEGRWAVDRDAYVMAMEWEVLVGCRSDPPNYGKVAKRLYNLCRLTDRRLEAGFLRELFDEPMARWYGARTRLAALLAALLAQGVAENEEGASALAAFVEQVAVLGAETLAEPGKMGGQGGGGAIERPAALLRRVAETRR